MNFSLSTVKNRITITMIMLIVATLIFGLGILKEEKLIVIGGAFFQIISLYLVFKYSKDISEKREGFEYYVVSATTVILLGLGVFLFISSLILKNWIYVLDSAVLLIAGYTIYWKGGE